MAEDLEKALADAKVHWTVASEWNWRARFYYITYLGEIWNRRLDADVDGQRRVGRGWGELAWTLYYEPGDYATAAALVPEEIKNGEPAREELAQAT